jgi:flagellar biosynthesis/type III secretory pathway protein FliH
MHAGVAKRPGVEFPRWQALVEASIAGSRIAGRKQEGSIMAQSMLDIWFTQGEDKGRNEGRIEGRNEGRIEGRNEGRVEEAQNSVLNALRFRLGTVSDAVSSIVREIADLEVLDALLIVALEAESEAALLARVAANSNGQHAH